MKLFTALLSISLFIASFYSQAEERLIQTQSQAEIPVSIYPQKAASQVVLWLPTEYGLHGKEKATAIELSQMGLEVWIADLHGAYFLPTGRRSYEEIDINDIVDLITAVKHQSGKQVVLFATGRSAPIALKATRQLQLNDTTKDYVQSAVLFHPNFYLNTTEVGKAVSYQDITFSTNLALYIVQPSLSGKAYQLQTLQSHLEIGGSDVVSQIIPDVADGFNIREPESDNEQLYYEKTPDIIFKATQLLSYFTKPRDAAKLISNQNNNTSKTLQIGLQKYNGNIKDLYIDFIDRKDKRHTTESHKGKVILVNFWASWCPPCVKELPSLDRLQTKIGNDNFTVLAINIGENRETVKQFLEPMDLEIPVLFDPDGKAVKAWNLLAFPSSFVIDQQGTIRYGLFGGIEWDNENVMEIINKLLIEK